MSRRWAALVAITLSTGCLAQVTPPDPDATPGPPAAVGESQDVFHDPVLLTGGLGLGLAVVGGLAGLVACQTENCFGTKDPTQADSYQVKYGYPVMAIGLATGLPLYIGAWAFAVARDNAQRRDQLLDGLLGATPTPVPPTPAPPSPAP